METNQKINLASVQKLGNSIAKKIIALDYASFHHLLGEPIFGSSDANVYAVKKYGGRPDRPPAITPFKIHSALSTSYDLCERYNLPTSIEYLNSVISSTQEYMHKAVRAVEGWDLLYLHRGSLFYQDGSIRLAFADYMKAAQLNPYNPMVYSQVADMFGYFISEPRGAHPGENTFRAQKTLEGAKMALVNMGVSIKAIDSGIVAGCAALSGKYASGQSIDPSSIQGVIDVLDRLDALLDERARIAGRMRRIFSRFCYSYPDRIKQLKEGIRHCARALSLPLASVDPSGVNELVARTRRLASSLLKNAFFASGVSPAALSAYRDSARSGNAPVSIRAPDDGSLSMNVSDDQIRINVSNAPRPIYPSRDELTDRNIWDANKY